MRAGVEAIDRRRTLQLQAFRIAAWGVGGLIGLPFRHYTGRLWWLSLTLATVALATWPVLRRVRAFRAVNTGLFVLDLMLTEYVIWQFGVLVTHAIFWLPAILIAAAFYLDEGATLVLWLVAGAAHLALIVAQLMGLVPASPLAAAAGVPPEVLRNPVLAEQAIGFTVFALPLSLALARRLMRLFRHRELELASANDVIARYVPAQLAARILSGEHQADAPPERRKLTLFFSDIKDFTQTTDQLEAEDLSRILNEYLSEMATIAERHGGTIDKFVGDAVMIFFGAPVATDDRDHALRAVRMAVQMQRRTAELATRWFHEGIPVPFQVRMGVNTGPASVGSFGSEGRRDYTAIGNQVNLAARLEAECPPGGILISHATWALVRDEIPCDPQGELRVKGLHYPVRVYLVRQDGSDVTRAAPGGPPSRADRL